MKVPATRPGRGGSAARFWALLGLLLFSTLGAKLYAYDVTVAKDGTGNYTTIQAAVTAAPTGRTAAYTIYIKDGIYAEKVTVPSTKPFLQFVGQSVANTILTWNDNALTPNGTGGTVGTGGSGSIIINGTDFSALNMTFVNSFGDGSQAVAVSAYADRAAFKNCRFLGNQDTLLTFEQGGAISRQYFKDCYIDGNVDFIFGSAIAIFDNCVIYAKTRVVNAATSYITAANTPATQNYGYLFRNARIPSNNGTTLYYLGRPWQNSTGFSTAAGTLANNKVIFSKTRIGVNEVQPAGWVVWDSGTDVSKITFGEFQTKYFNGNNVNTSQRVSWSQQLTPTDTLNYGIARMFGTGTGTATSTGSPVAAAWDPSTVAAGFSSYTAPDIAVANLQATKGSTLTSIQWNISWAMTGIQYALQRSSDNTTFSTINTQTATTDSLYNFSATDALPAAGSAYYYRVVASKAGMATHTTPSVQVSSIPTITVSGAPNAFAQYATGTSAVQTYSVAGQNLTDNLTITPPASYEVSANGGTNWYTAASPLVLTPTSNTLASTTISVRLNASTAGTYSGNIAHTSAGAASVNVAVTGTKTNTTQLNSTRLQLWSLRVSNQDSAAVRSAGATPSPQLLRRLAVADGSVVSTISGYSSKFGQPVALVAGGSWSTSATPPAPVTVGASLDRRFYEQYTITAAAGHSLRLDSLLMTAAFYNSANGRMALVYSLSGFTTADSTNIPAGGKGPTGTLPTANNGAFATPIILANQTGGPTNVYRFALSTSTSGLTLAAGQTLTLRVYLGAGTSSAGRYALLRDVQFKGEDVVACNAAFSYAAAAYCRTGTNPTPTVTGTTGGTFSSTPGLTIDASTGTITLSSSTAGNYTVTYTASAGCTSTQGVTITAPPLANIGYGAASYCTTTTGTVALGIGTGSTLGTITVNPTTGLTIAANGTITPSTSTPGTYFITNTVAASGGCAAVTGGTTVSIAAPATAGFAYPTATACAGTATTLAATLATGATAGTFSLSGAPAGLTINASTGAVTVAATAAASTYTVTNTVAASGGCAAVTATATFTLTAPTTATFSYANSPFCKSSTASPTPTITGTAGGTFSSGSGLTIDASTGAITLNSSAAGTYVVTYTVSGACGSSSTQSITITNAPTANIGYGAASYCTTTTGTVALGIGTGSTLGTITVNPATGLTIAANGTITPSTSTPGTYFITNTVAAAGGCAAVTGGTTVTIAAPATAGFSFPTAVSCAGTATTLTPTLATGATAGTFSLPTATGLSINATTGVVTVGATAAAGAYTVTNTVAASGGCAAVTSTATLTITAPTTATFSYAGSPFCKSNTTNPTATVTGTAGGTFSSGSGLTINATTGAITLSSSAAGTYVVTYTVSGACGSSSTQSITITNAPTANIGYAASSYCTGTMGTVALGIGTGSTLGTITVNPATGLTIAANGTITPSTSTPGTYFVTNTVAAAGGCAAVTGGTTVTINATPATPTLTTSGTAGTGITLTSSSTTGNQFYRNGVLITGATGQSYTILSGAQNGTYTVVVMGAGGCASATSASVTVTVTATAAAQATSLTVYPNPTPDGHLTLELSGYREAVQLTISNTLGQRVQETTVSAAALGRPQALDLSGLPAGVYVLQARTASGEVAVRRIVRD